MFIGHKLRRAAQKGGIEFVGRIDAADNGTLSSQTLALDSGLIDGIDTAVQEGDLVIVAQSVNRGATDQNLTITTSGYTEVADLYSNDTESINFGVHYKVMGATPDTDVEVPVYTGTFNSHVVMVFVFRGVDETTPMDVTATTNTGTNTADVNPPAITPITNGAVIVTANGAAHDHGGAVTYSGLSEYAYSVERHRNAGTNDSSLLMGYVTGWESGAYDPALHELSTDSVNNSNASVTMALRPA